MKIEEELANIYFKTVEERKSPYDRETAYWDYYNNLLVAKFNMCFFSKYDNDLLKKVIQTRNDDLKTYGDYNEATIKEKASS